MGKAAAGRDPSAIGVAGWNRETGVMDVVEAAIRKRTPDRIISDIIETQREWNCIVWGFEAVAFQEFARTELVKRSAKAGVPVPARGIVPTAEKDLRILSLQPHMANGLIRLHPRLVTLIDMFKHYPKADHDDGPDMVSMLWMLCVTGGMAVAVQSTTQEFKSARERYGRQAARMFSRSR
jgi:predicted phage terminase large subunit-like protein